MVPAAQDDNSDGTAQWLWLLAAIVLIGVVVAVVMFVRRRGQQQHAEAAWKKSASTALDNATGAQALLAGIADSSDPQARARVASQVENAAAGLDRVRASAPDAVARDLAGTAAESLRGAMFSIDAEQLLRAGNAPTADQLADADRTRRERAADLDQSLALLRAAVADESARMAT